MSSPVNSSTSLRGLCGFAVCLLVFYVIHHVIIVPQIPLEVHLIRTESDFCLNPCKQWFVLCIEQNDLASTLYSHPTKGL